MTIGNFLNGTVQQSHASHHSGSGFKRLAVDVWGKLVDRPAVDKTDKAGKEGQWNVIAGALTYEERIYVPAVGCVCGKVISLFHDNPQSGHFGALKTTELVSSDFYWPVMDSGVRKYGSSCKVCRQIKAPWHVLHGIIIPLDPSPQPWEGVRMDFVTDLPRSMALGYNWILGIMDWLTMMGLYIPGWKDIYSPELAWDFFEHIICKRGVPEIIVTDRNTQFTSWFWTQVCSHLRNDHWLSTAFHPQTKRRRECQNQTMEQYPRACCNYQQDNWVELLMLAKFAYNNMVHASTRITPFWANYHYHPVMQCKALKQPPSLKLDIEADIFAVGLEETHLTLSKNLQEAQACQTIYAPC